MTERFKNILIIKPSSLGDIVLTLPALSALRRSFPQAKINWLVRPDFAAILEDHPDLDEIIPFDRKLLGKAWFHPGAFGALISLIRKLRRSKFDVVFDFQGLFRTASLAWLSGCKKRFGMANAREYAHVFYTDKVAPALGSIHLVDHYLKMVGCAGASDVEARFVLPVDPEAEKKVAHLLISHNVNPENYAVLVPSSAHPDKCWPRERFAALADMIAERFGMSIVTTGTSSEKSIGDEVGKLAKTAVVNLAGQTNIRELVALFRPANLAISNDTGPGHIAAALGVPLVILFGRTNPARVAPYQRADCFAAVDPEGRGSIIDSPDPKHHIINITVEQVYQEVCKQMDNR
ncbi:MAG: glycosyltransferase family 9 protein [Sedimentisphaerales bacterium]